MDALKFLQERQRLCKAYYDAENGVCGGGCPLYTVQCMWLDNLGDESEELVDRVEAWSAAHPCKTRQSVFLKQWPNAMLDSQGVVNIQPCVLDKSLTDTLNCRGRNCTKCYREFWMQEQEVE